MKTILHRLSAWAESNPTSVAQAYRKGDGWATISAQEFCERVYWLALFLESKGLSAEEIVSIYSYNCPQWVQIELAAILLGAKSAGIYPNSTPKDVLFILNHTHSRVLAIQNEEYFKRLTGPDSKSPLPDHLDWLLVFEGSAAFSPKAIAYEAALQEGKKIAAKNGEKKLPDLLQKLDPDVGSMIIYTSGTTGEPKGALISQRNIVETTDIVVAHWNLPAGNGSLFSFLPLCHIAEKLQNMGAGISQNYAVYYCSNFENVGVELPQVSPTLLLCVPRVWEKMMEGVLKKVSESKGAQKALAQWALAVGSRVYLGRLRGQKTSLLDEVQLTLADRLILSKIRKALGLNKAVALASGAAPLAPYVYEWFWSLGLEICEAFGQTETTGVICLTDRGVDSAGTVGRAPRGVEVKLAEDGEILVRGAPLFKGYYKNEAATAAVFQNGWLVTGDLGEKDSRGYIRIRGRKKEILKTSGGKMVAPVPIEEELKVSPLISQVCVVGDGRKFLSALITLSEHRLKELKEQGGVSAASKTIRSPEAVGEVKKVVDALNAKRANFEQVKKFAILSKEFSIVDGEMTPTLKMKRSVIEKRYEDVINQFYDSAS